MQTLPENRSKKALFTMVDCLIINVLVCLFRLQIPTMENVFQNSRNQLDISQHQIDLSKSKYAYSSNQIDRSRKQCGFEVAV